MNPFRRFRRQGESLRARTRRVEDACREMARAEERARHDLAEYMLLDDPGVHHWTWWAEAEFDRSDADSTAAATEEDRRDGRAHGERPARPEQAHLTTSDRDDGQ